ncbi:hypothetical protein [Mesorhizobium sp. WSM2239]|uniref:Flagellar assembly protein FliH n=2 Tax=unclassified Mesorhizobium TaxID=325217 RepID=A0AAU8DDT6_9HYPH
MAALALFDVLTDFGKRPQRTGAPQPASAEPGASQAPFSAPAAPPPDLSEIIATEVARAELALEQRLSLAHEAALEAERQAHAAEIETLMRRFGEEAGQAITTKIAEMEGRLGDLATSATARMLGGFLSEELARRSLDALARAVRAAIGDAEAVRIQVRGPQSLFETLQAALGDRAACFDYIEAPGLDLTVSIDGNLFETRLSEWSGAMQEILS